MINLTKTYQKISKNLLQNVPQSPFSPIKLTNLLFFRATHVYIKKFFRKLYKKVLYRRTIKIGKFVRF